MNSSGYLCLRFCIRFFDIFHPCLNSLTPMYSPFRRIFSFYSMAKGSWNSYWQQQAISLPSSMLRMAPAASLMSLVRANTCDALPYFSEFSRTMFLAYCLLRILTNSCSRYSLAWQQSKGSTYSPSKMAFLRLWLRRCFLFWMIMVNSWYEFMSPTLFHLWMCTRSSSPYSLNTMYHSHSTLFSYNRLYSMMASLWLSLNLLFYLMIISRASRWIWNSVRRTCWPARADSNLSRYSDSMTMQAGLVISSTFTFRMLLMKFSSSSSSYQPQVSLRSSYSTSLMKNSWNCCLLGFSMRPIVITVYSCDRKLLLLLMTSTVRLIGRLQFTYFSMVLLSRGSQNLGLLMSRMIALQVSSTCLSSSSYLTSLRMRMLAWCLSSYSFCQVSLSYCFCMPAILYLSSWMALMKLDCTMKGIVCICTKAQPMGSAQAVHAMHGFMSCLATAQFSSHTYSGIMPKKVFTCSTRFQQSQFYWYYSLRMPNFCFCAFIYYCGSYAYLNQASLRYFLSTLRLYTSISYSMQSDWDSSHRSLKNSTSLWAC